MATFIAEVSFFSRGGGVFSTGASGVTTLQSGAVRAIRTSTCSAGDPTAFSVVLQEEIHLRNCDT